MSFKTWLREVHDLFISFLARKMPKCVLVFQLWIFYMCRQKTLRLSGEIVFMPITLIRPYSNLEYPDPEQNKNCKPLIDLVNFQNHLDSIFNLKARQHFYRGMYFVTTNLNQLCWEIVKLVLDRVRRQVWQNHEIRLRQVGCRQEYEGLQVLFHMLHCLKLVRKCQIRIRQFTWFVGLKI